MTKREVIPLPKQLTSDKIAESLQRRVDLSPVLIAGQIVSENEQAEKALVVADAFEVTTAKDAGDAADVLRAMKSSLERIDRMRKDHTAPLDAAKEAIHNLFKIPFTKMTKAQLVLTSKLNAWRVVEQRRLTLEAEDRRKAQAAKAKAAAEVHVALGDMEGAKQIVEEAAAVQIAPEKIEAVGIYGSSVGSRSRAVGSVGDRRKFLRALADSDSPALVEILEGITFPQISLNRLAAAVEKGDEISPPGFASTKTDSTVVR